MGGERTTKAVGSFHVPWKKRHRRRKENPALFDPSHDLHRGRFFFYGRWLLFLLLERTTDTKPRDQSSVKAENGKRN